MCTIDAFKQSFTELHGYMFTDIQNLKSRSILCNVQKYNMSEIIEAHRIKWFCAMNWRIVKL